MSGPRTFGHPRTATAGAPAEEQPNRSLAQARPMGMELPVRASNWRRGRSGLVCLQRAQRASDMTADHGHR